MLAAAALIAAAAACAGSGADKAGGESKAKPVVLTFESEEDLTLSGAPEFADALERLSGGSVRIEFVAAGRGELADGRFRFQGDPGSDKSATGTYAVRGAVIRLVFETGIALQLGRPYDLKWNVYRGSLTFSAVPGSEALKAFLTAPYTRVR